MEELKHYDNITFKKEHYGFSLSGEDEKQKAILRVDVDNPFPGSLVNLVRKWFSIKPELTIGSEFLEITDKTTGRLTEVIDLKSNSGLDPCTYFEGKIDPKYCEGEDLLDEARERLHFDAYQRHYEQSLMWQNNKSKSSK